MNFDRINQWLSCVLLAGMAVWFLPQLIRGVIMPIFSIMDPVMKQVERFAHWLEIKRDRLQAELDKQKERKGK